MKRKINFFILIFVFGFASFFSFLLPINNQDFSANAQSSCFEKFANSCLDLIKEYETNDVEDIELDLNREVLTLNGSYMISCENFVNSTNASVFKESEEEYIIQNEEKTVCLNVNDNVFYVNDDIYISTQTVNRIGDTLYLPVEDISKSLGYELRFDGDKIYLYRPYATKRIIVKSNFENLDNCGATKVVEGFDNLHIYQYSTEEETIEACEYFKNLQNVDWWQVDNVITPQNIENENFVLGLEDSYSYTSWGAESMGVESYSNYLLNTVSVNNLREVVIAVLDTGIDTDHVWFENRIVSGGKNFSSSTSATGYEYEDGHGHGTHVSGIICDLTLSNVKILPIKVMNDQGYGYSSQIMLGINYVTQLRNSGMNIYAMNLSLGNSSSYIGSDEYNMYVESLGAANDNGIIPVVAAGNDGDDVSGNAPANVDFAITVAAVGKLNSSYYHPSWSNYGTYVDVSAPGLSIVSAKAGGGTVAMSGTSMAAPHVAAAVGLLMSDGVKNYSTTQIESLLKSNVIDLGDDGWDILFGDGMVNLEYAYAELIDDVYFSNSVTDCTDPFYLELLCQVADSKIYYTMDGSIPSLTNGNVYEDQILIDKTQRVRARAYVLSNGNVIKYSKISQMTYCFYGQDVDGAFNVSSDGVLISYSGVLTNVVMPKVVNGITVVAIGDNAFASSKIVTITLPSTVTKIGRYSFMNCSNLQTIYSPNVTSIDMYAFQGCSSLKFLTDEYFPNLTSIGKYAFYQCYNLRPIFLSNVSIVDYWAFGMKNVSPSYLTSVTLPNASIIAEGAFIFCEYLSSIEMPNVEIIASDAFRECDLINVTLPEVKYLGNRAFYVNENLLSVNMPEVLVVGNACFYSFCVKLNSVNMPKVKTICSTAFRDCTSLTHLSFPEVETIGDWAFYDCDKLETVYTPKLKYINYVAFGSCDKLKEVNLPSVISIGGGAFRMDGSLIKVTLSSCLESILDNSFGASSSCVFYYYSGTAADNYLSKQNYTKVNLSSQNSYFVYETHNDEIYITGYTSAINSNVIIPSFIDNKPVTKICASAFENCQYVTNLCVSYLTEIGENSFKGCENLKSVYLTRIQTISTSAFENCTSLNEINIENVLSIGDNCFYGCSSLLMVRFSENIVQIGNNALGYNFDGNIIPTFVIYGYADTVAKTYADSKNITFRAIFNNISHYYYNTYVNPETGNTEIYISFVDSYISGNVIFQSEYKGMVISKIGEEAFHNCSLITGIVLPDTIKTIEMGAFYGCTMLESINLENITKFDYTTGYGAFYCCSSLKKVNLPLVTDIPRNTFDSCSSLTYVYAPNAETIGTSAFGSCYSLKTIVCPKVKTLGMSAFGYCSSLETIVCPNLEELEFAVFAYDHCLKNIDTLNLRVIEQQAFLYCTSLTQMYLPKLETMDHDIFGASSITKVVIGKNLNEYSDIALRTSVVIYGYRGSTAETYANQRGNTFIAIDEFEIVNNLLPSQSVELNSDFSLQIDVNGFELTYQWYLTPTNSIEDGIEIENATSNNLSIDTSNLGAKNYFVKVVNWDGEIFYSNVSVVYVYTPGNVFEIISTSGENGNIYPSGNIKVAEGFNQLFVFVASLGYKVKSIIIDNVALEGINFENAVANGYLFDEVDSDHTIQVLFEKQTFIIFVEEVEGCVITPNGEVVVEYNANLTLYITANSGYKLSKLIIDGEDYIGTNLSVYTFIQVSQNHTFSVVVNGIIEHTIEDVTTTYDGEYHNIVVNVENVEEYTILFGLSPQDVNLSDVTNNDEFKNWTNGKKKIYFVIKSPGKTDTDGFGYLEITKKDLNIYISNQHGYYGDEPNLNQSSYTLNYQPYNDDDLNICLTTTANSRSSCGGYPISMTFDNDNYSISVYEQGYYTVVKRNISIALLEQNSYYGDKINLLNNYSIISGSIVNNDTLNLITATDATSTSVVGNYEFYLRSYNANYNITYSPGVLKIVERPISIVIEQVSIYGNTVNLNVTGYGVTSGSVVNNDILIFGLSTEANNLSNVGEYEVFVDSYNSNYNLTIDSAYISIIKRNAFISVGHMTSFYGDEIAISENNFSLTNVANDDDLNIVLSTNATNLSSVGEYEINASFSNDNYTLAVKPGVLTIVKRNATLTIDNKTSIYGDNISLENDSYNLTNVVNDDNLNIVLSTNATKTSNVGDYVINASFNNINYDLTIETGTLTILKRVANIKVDNISKIYGENITLNQNAFTLTNVVNNDNLHIELLTTANNVSNIGEYDITASYSNNNYDLIVQKGTLTISKRTAYIFIGNETKSYGDEISLDQDNYNLTNIVNNDNLNIVLSTSATSSSNIGKYDITATYSNDNYTLDIRTGTLSLTKRQASIVINNASTIYGNEIALNQIDFTLSNVVNNDNLHIELLTTATQHSNAGEYEITATYSNDNYSLLVANAVLTIEKRPITISFEQDFRYGDEIVLDLNNVDIVYSSIVEGDNLALSLQTEARQFSDIGYYEITVAGCNENYTVSLILGSKLSITPREIEIYLGKKVAKYGDEISFENVSNDLSEVLNNDNLNIELSTNANNRSPVGEYVITATYNNANYDVSFVDGEYIVEPKEIDIVVVQNDFYGQDHVVGNSFVDKDNAILSGDNLNLVLSCDINKDSNAGKYDFVIESNNLNYSVNLVDSFYEIWPRQITIELKPQTLGHLTFSKPNQEEYDIVDGEIVNNDDLGLEIYIGNGTLFWGTTNILGKSLNSNYDVRFIVSKANVEFSTVDIVLICLISIATISYSCAIAIKKKHKLNQNIKDFDKDIKRLNAIKNNDVENPNNQKDN